MQRKYLVEYDLAGHFGPLAARKSVLYERRLAALPAPGPGRDRLCDVGCGDGQFLALAAARGWNPHGVEPNPPAARRAADAGARVRLGLLEDLDDLEWGSFDLVTSWDVLEHTPEPRQFAERLVRLLAPGGWLALTTLNFRSLARLVFGMRWSMICEDHFTYWTAPSLIALFRSLGVVIIRVDNFGLGRDFVTVLDRLWPSRADVAAPDPLGPRRAWDVAAPTLLVERLLNRCFRLAGGGVGLGLTMRRPALPDGSSRGVM